MKKFLVGLFFILCLSAVSFAQGQLSDSGRTKGPEYVQGKETIIVLSTVTLDEMRFARKILEKNGVEIELVFAPSVFIAKVPKHLEKALKELDFIEELAYEKLDVKRFKDYEASALDGIKFWNEHIDEQRLKKTWEKKAVKGEKQLREPFKDDLIIPTDLPKSKAEKIKQDEEYKKRWQVQKIKIDSEEKAKKQSWQKKHSKKNKPQTKGAPLILMAAQEKGIAPASLNSFGRAYGAGYNDTSLYMAGDIAVGVVFVSGSWGEWPEAEKTNVYNSLVSALRQFSQDEPNAQITFYPVKESSIPQVGDPSRKIDLSAHRENVTDVRAYVNNLRNNLRTHWAYLIVVEYGVGRSYAHFWGPLTRIFSSGGLTINRSVRHETMHIFGAADQYREQAKSPTERWGYLGVVNANSEYNDGTGYFSGAGEDQSDIMISGWPIGVYSRGQIGWRDSDGDGILDPLDTYPDNTNLTRVGSNPFIYTGKALDKPLLNNGSWVYSDVTLNTITKVEWRVNGSVWLDASPSDGRFDNGEENFTFSLPALKNGTYTVEVRTTNSVDNTEVSYAKDTFRVTDSTVINNQPFAAFSIAPDQTSLGHDVLVDASLSSDIEDSVDKPWVRWNFKRDDGSDSWTAFSTNKIARTPVYATAGTKTIQLEVKDTQGANHIITKQVNVASQNLAPYAFFTTQPENQHGLSKFNINLDASKSFDPEDNQDVQVRWDFEDDGIWDTPYSNVLSIDHTYRFFGPNTIVSRYNAGAGFAFDVYVSGNYAYVADRFSGLQIIDISNPRAPVLAANYASNIFGFFIFGNYAYVADQDSGLRILDITNPRAPVLAGSYHTPDYARGVYVSGNYAYVTEGASGLQIIDITNPRAPVLTGSYKTAGYAYGIYVSANYAYVADLILGLQIIDITNPRAPFLAGSYHTPGHATSVYISGNYAYVADQGSGLQIIDISNPRAPVLAGSYDTSGNAYGVYISGDYAYVADAESLRVVDITNPLTPILVESYDTPGSARNVFVSTNYVYVADGTSGLQIIDITPKLPELKSLRWKIKAEVIDKTHKVSSVTRDVWAVNYNQPPFIEGIKFMDRIIYTGIGTYKFSRVYPNGVYVSGNYAYVAGGSSGLQIIDISNPRAPVLAGSYDTPDDAYDVYVFGNYAYVTDLASTLQIIDITDPHAPVLAGSYDAPDSALGIYVSGNYAYVAAYHAGLQIIDITNPRAPVLAGSYDTPGNAYDVYVSGNYAYVADGSSGLQIIDITNPRAPVLAGSYDTLGAAHDVYLSGNYAYVADGSSGLQIMDISNPHAPALIGSSDISSNYAFGVYISGNYAYVAYGYSGLQIIDVSNPRVPILAGSYNTVGVAKGVYVSGNYAYVAVAYEWNGLQIVSTAHQLVAQAVNAHDPDVATTWDGLLEYRWDFEHDGIWDTHFSLVDSVGLPETLTVSELACQVRDRFGATALVTADWPDTTPPTTTLSYSPVVVSGTTYPAYTPGTWTKNPVTVNLTAVDSGSGVKEVLYSLDGSEPSIKYSKPIFLYQNGIYNLQYRAIDNVGNREDAKSAEIKLDMQGILMSNLSVQFAKKQVEYTVTAIDPQPGSGVKKLQLSLRAAVPDQRFQGGLRPIIGGWKFFDLALTQGDVYKVRVPEEALGPKGMAVFNITAEDNVNIRRAQIIDNGVKGSSFLLTYNPHTGTVNYQRRY